MISKNHFYDHFKHHCDYKLDLYRKMFHELTNKQEKHISSDGSINKNNNNNSTTIRFSTGSSSSNTSTPQEYYSSEHYQSTKTSVKKSRRTEIRDVQRKFLLSTSRH